MITSAGMLSPSTSQRSKRPSTRRLWPIRMPIADPAAMASAKLAATRSKVMPRSVSGRPWTASFASAVAPGAAPGGGGPAAAPATACHSTRKLAADRQRSQTSLRRSDTMRLRAGAGEEGACRHAAVGRRLVDAAEPHQQIEQALRLVGEIGGLAMSDAAPVSLAQPLQYPRIVDLRERRDLLPFLGRARQRVPRLFRRSKETAEGGVVGCGPAFAEYPAEQRRLWREAQCGQHVLDAHQLGELALGQARIVLPEIDRRRQVAALERLVEQRRRGET